MNLSALLLAIITFLISRPCAASDFSVSGHSSTLRITTAGEQHRIIIPEEVKVDMDDAVLLARKQVGELRFLLLFVTGPSRRGGNGMGHCGSGIESSIVWLKLDGWRISDYKFRLVESCWHGISLLKPISWKDETCVVNFWDFEDNNQEFTLSYDSRKPSDGFRLASKPFN